MLTYYGNLFSRANTDPYHNSNPVNTQYLINGYSDIDRRESDRGSLYVSDINDNPPGDLRLKSGVSGLDTPTLQVAAPGPDSLRTGYFEPAKPCCSQQEEEEDDEDPCDFLNSLPTPSEYKQQLDQSSVCSYYYSTVCNIYTLEINWLHVDGAAPQGAPCDKSGAGRVCRWSSPWTECYIFPNYKAFNAAWSVVEPLQVGRYHNATIGNHIFAAFSPWRDRDTECKDMGCLVFPDRMSPVAYATHDGWDPGCEGDGECREDNFWSKFITS